MACKELQERILISRNKAGTESSESEMERSKNGHENAKECKKELLCTLGTRISVQARISVQSCKFREI